MAGIKWCLNIKNGIEIAEPNSNLASAYTKKAESSLETMRLIQTKDWKISAGYYSMYFSLYAVLMKIGIKCENHACTIAFMKSFLSSSFTEEDAELIKKSMGARIDAQYYVDREVAEDLYQRIIAQSPLFLVKCKEILRKITEQEIGNIRNKLIKLRD